MRRAGTYALTLGPRGHEYERAHVLTEPEYGSVFLKGVRVKIGDKKMTLGEGTIVSSDLPLRMCLPIVGKPLGVLEIGHYLVSNLTLAASYTKRSNSAKSKNERDFESKKCYVIGTDGNTYERLDDAMQKNSAVYIFITVLAVLDAEDGQGDASDWASN